MLRSGRLVAWSRIRVDHDLFDLKVRGIGRHIRAVGEKDGQGQCDRKRKHCAGICQGDHKKDQNKISQEREDQALKADKGKDQGVFEDLVDRKIKSDHLQIDVTPHHHVQEPDHNVEPKQNALEKSAVLA